MRGSTVYCATPSWESERKRSVSSPKSACEKTSGCCSEYEIWSSCGRDMAAASTRCRCHSPVGLLLGEEVDAALRADLQHRGVEEPDRGHLAVRLQGPRREHQHLAEGVLRVADGERRREAGGLLPTVAEDQHLAALVGQVGSCVLRRLLGELRLDQRREGLLPAGAVVLDAPLALRAGRLAHRAHRKLRDALRSSDPRQPQVAHLGRRRASGAASTSLPVRSCTESITSASWPGGGARPGAVAPAGPPPRRLAPEEVATPERSCVGAYARVYAPPHSRHEAISNTREPHASQWVRAARRRACRAGRARPDRTADRRTADSRMHA